MPLKIHDGYTLSGQTSGKGNTDSPLPVLCFEYRPPTSEEMTDFRFQQQRCSDGRQLHGVRVAFLKSRLVSWDFLDDSDKTRPITAENITALPEELFVDLVHECQQWKPKPQEDARKNS